MTRIGVFNKKRIRYNPGTIYVCLKLPTSIPEGLDLLSQFNLKAGKIYDPKIVEVHVENNDTLTMAQTLIDSKLFRFIDLDIEENNYRNAK